MELRPYQIEAIQELREGFAKHQRQILCLPTGAGKTVIFSDMIRAAVEKGTQTLVVTDRIELCTQTLNAILRHNIPTQIIRRETKKFYPEAQITLAMVETIARRIKKWDLEKYSPKLLIIDEAHKAAFNKIMDAFPLAKTIGATATPKAKFLHKYYTNIVDNIDIPDLVDQGFLSKCRGFQMEDDFSDVEVKHGEYVESQLFAHFHKRELYDGVVEKYKEKSIGKKCLVFNVNIDHSENMSKAFNEAGIHSECVTSLTPPEERKRILAAFEAGHFPVLNNCGILTTGFDCPSIETIIMNRATKSLPLWLQCCGRGSRIYPGKPYFTVLDFGKNHEEHGMWAEARDWDLDPPKKKKKGVAPMKTCPTCSAMLPARATECEFCGHKFTAEEVELKKGILVEVTAAEKINEFKGRMASTLSVPELVILSKSGLQKKSYIFRVVRSKGEQALRDYGWQMGYKEGWVYNQMKELNDCKFKDKIL